MIAQSLAAQLGLARARTLGAGSDQVVGRRALLAAGVPRWLVQRELRVGRWSRAGRQAVVLHNGPLDVAARRRVALLEVGPRAALDGVTALQHDGVTALTDEEIHVITPQGSQRSRRLGVVVHESRRFREEDVAPGSGPRRMRPAVAGVHAALWARTPRQASYLLILPVQQGLCTVEELVGALERVRRHTWRSELWRTAVDLVGGVRSLNELDIARGMRSRGLPEPSRQVMRRRPSGTQYLDAEFDEFDLVMEVDGPQHGLPWMVLADTVRDIQVVTEGKDVVRIPSLAWQLDQARVLDALEELFVARGWRRPAA